MKGKEGDGETVKARDAAQVNPSDDRMGQREDGVWCLSFLCVAVSLSLLQPASHQLQHWRISNATRRTKYQTEIYGTTQDGGNLTARRTGE